MVSSLDYSYKKQTRQDFSYAEDPIVLGNFPAFENFKELAIFKVNRFLSVLLISSIVVPMVTYSAVVAKESKISTIHDEIHEINYENLELQNKVDYLKSFSNVDKKISKSNLLVKTDNVLEVNTVTPQIKKSVNKRDLTFKTILGY